MIGNLVGSYKIIGKIGDGGMGAVFRGIDIMLEREVAIKMLRPELSQQPNIVERFRSEAVTLAKLSHPNIATLYSFVRQGDDFFMVMEYVRGETLDSLIRRSGMIGCDRAINLVCQALEGIEHAHKMGIIHRDIKPANIMLTESGTLKVMDFGIARVLGSARMTRQGNIVGTIEYMSPEQVRGQETDSRSDIYSLGILLYEMLTGSVPFRSDSEYDLMKMQIEDVPQKPSAFSGEIPQAVEQVIMRSLAKHPEARFQTASALREALLMGRESSAPSSSASRSSRGAEPVSVIVPKETRLADEPAVPTGAIHKLANPQGIPKIKSPGKLYAGIIAVLVVAIAGMTVVLLRRSEHTDAPSSAVTRPDQATSPASRTTLPPAQTAADIDPTKPPGDLISRETKEQNKKYAISVRFPQIIGSSQASVEAFDEAVNRLIREKISHFKKDIEEPEGEMPRSSLNIRYEVGAVNGALISVVFSVQEYGSGAAHSNDYTLVMNYDLKSGKPILLAELFKPGSDYMNAISRYCIARLKKRLGALSDDDWINRGASPSLQNYGNWSITKKGLMITFDPYQVAAYAAGAQKLLVPYESLKDVINPSSSLASFLK